MEWKDITGVITKLAPMIATGLGGPLAGGAVAALEQVFGLDTKGTLGDKQDAIVAALSGATPDQLLALKKADLDYSAQMATLGFKNEEALAALETSDRDSARKREIEVKDNTPKILAYSITLGFFGVLLFMMLATVPAASRDILNIMLGTLGTAWTGVVSYYYGSTNGSAAKTKLLAASQKV